MTAGPPRATAELRVHGVGGAHGPKMLGYESATDVVVVEEGDKTRVLASRWDPSIESYDWGDLTSGKGLRALWLLLLPFTLMNVAGWMHPPLHRSSLARVKRIRALVQVLSLMLTAIYVITLGVIVVDLIGWQWSRRLVLPGDEAAYPAGVGSTLTTQRWAATAALMVVAALVIGLRFLAGRSHARFEGTPLPPALSGRVTGNERWGDDEQLTSRGFFFHPGAASRLLFVHTVAAGLSLAVVVGLTVWRAWLHPVAPAASLQIYQALALPTAVVIAGIAGLYALSLRHSRRAREPWAWGGPAIAATLAFAVLNAVSAGAHVFLLKRLNDWPKLPMVAGSLKAGPEVSVVDLWGAVTCGLVLVAAGLVAYTFTRPPATDIPEAAGRKVRKAVARSRVIVGLARGGGAIALTVAVTLLTLYTVVVVHRMVGADGLFLPAPRDLDGNLYRIGAYVLPALVVALARIVRRDYRGSRTFASTVWDVLTFWPRRFSPLGVRPYSEQAIPELQGRILHHVRNDRPVLLSAHSQGSILGFAALSSLPDDDLRHVAFVTYGSPVSTIFATFFPAYFGSQEVEGLRSRLPSPGDDREGWKNFYRRTDPIGGPAFGPGPDSADEELADPFPGPAVEPDGSTPPRERDRPPWTQVAGHSHYLAEPVLKRWVAAVRSALART